MTWLDELEITAGTTPHAVLTGNTWDYVVSKGPEPRLITVIQQLIELGERTGLEYVVVADPVQGFSVRRFRPEAEDVPALPEEIGALPEYRTPEIAPVGAELVAPERLHALIATVAAGEPLGGVIVSDAPRFLVNAETIDSSEHEMLTVSARTARNSLPRRGTAGHALYPVVYWLCSVESDLPAWFLAEPCVRTVRIPPPDFDARSTVGAEWLSPAEASPQEKESVGRRVADVTDGMSLREVVAASELVRTREIDISAAATYVRLGVVDDPWQDPRLIDRVLSTSEFADAGEPPGKSSLRASVVGQPVAIELAWQGLVRSMSGLSGIHRPSSSRRPRLVMLLVGPTGTGKTELSKAIQRLIFGEGSNVIRFDMSGYSQEHSSQRLIGAPPGYTGHQSGGELTNALRERPFSVVLFDEVEKAHPAMWDMFLQIFDEGHLDDSRGRRAYFDQSVVVLTSNIGLYKENREVTGRVVSRTPLVSPDDPYDRIHDVVTSGVHEYFFGQLGRPELLNKLGDNVIVFDFIRPEAAAQIFDLLLQNAATELRRRGTELLIEESALTGLREACCADLSFGGRGIANRIESQLLSPLAVELARQLGQSMPTLRVTAWHGGAFPSVEVQYA